MLHEATLPVMFVLEMHLSLHGAKEQEGICRVPHGGPLSHVHMGKQRHRRSKALPRPHSKLVAKPG